MTCRTVRFIGTTEYQHRKGRPKVVAYFLMTDLDGEFAPNEEVDELRWCTVDGGGAPAHLGPRSRPARARGPAPERAAAPKGRAAPDRRLAPVATDPRPSQTSNTVDRYLETIYCIEGEGETVRPSRLAAWLGVSAPTVSVRAPAPRPRRVDRRRQDRSVTLTEEGHARGDARSCAGTACSSAGWSTCSRSTGRPPTSRPTGSRSRSPTWSSTASTGRWARPRRARTATRSRVALPGYGELVALATSSAGVRREVRRISEVAEHEARTLLTTLAEHGIAEGTEVEVEDEAPTDEGLLVRTGGRAFRLPAAAAQWIWVELLVAV